MQIIRSPKVYDVCIVGSGAGGGTTAKVLTEAGADVVMLEGGPMWNEATDSDMFAWSYDSPTRGWGGDKKPFGAFDGCIGGWDIEGEPYTVGRGGWRWFRGRMLGGRTHHWGRISLRFGPDDFQHKSIDGYGDDWPITYADMKPYYDKLDQFVGVFGSNHASETGLHNEPDGYFLPPPKPRAHELLIKQACDRLKIPVVPSRLSILTKPLNGRPACHYCGQCGRGCRTHSNFSSVSVMLPPALATGKLTIIANAMAREVTTGADGLATGVSYIDTEQGAEHQVRARIVVLAASCCESARLLLNSKSSRFPNGLANSSGVVGRYLTDSTGLAVRGFIPKLMDTPRYNADGVGGMHLYVPWWGNNKALGFPRGYHIELGGGFGMPGYGFSGGIHDYPQSRGGGYGAALKDEYRRYYGAFVSFSGRGEQVAREDNFCEIDPNVVDKWGIPVLRFNHTWADTERLQAKHMQDTFRSIIAEMGGVTTDAMPTEAQNYGLAIGGQIIHEAGAVRMGNDPKTSALNAHCQAHDVKNVFVADGGPFVSQADKNLTWTIMALAWRTSEYIADERRKGNI
ncbi:MAG TPA: GMC family oxidoreductase [Vicinamibacterales bacterium]|jgi:choline dehydrogenase-like flavoprotein|nr:GMC family oxidoreductase [Vicinamibacterales bacterium]